MGRCGKHISETITEARLIWLGHVERKTGEGVETRTPKKVASVHMDTRRPKLNWSAIIRKYTKYT